MTRIDAADAADAPEADAAQETGGLSTFDSIGLVDLGNEQIVDGGLGDGPGVPLDASDVPVNAPMNQPPTVAIAAMASPASVGATTTMLSVLGSDDQTEAALIYTWSTTGAPPGPVTFSVNGSNAAKSSSATFMKVGTYTFTVFIQDASGAAVSSATTATVVQVLDDLVVSPATVALQAGGIQQFNAEAFDQFGAALVTQPALTWALTGNCGTISPAGLFTAGLGAAASCTVTAASGTASDTASVTVGSAGLVVVPPNADSFVDESTPDKVEGVSPSLLVKKPTRTRNTRYAFFKFSLAGLTGSPSKAAFRLYGLSGGATTNDAVVAVDDISWTEAALTWRNKPALGAHLSASEVTATAKYRDWDVTSYVRAQRALGKAQISLALVMDRPSTDPPDRFNAREATSNPPQLVLTP